MFNRKKKFRKLKKKANEQAQMLRNARSENERHTIKRKMVNVQTEAAILREAGQ